MRDVVVDGSALTIDDVVAVARGQARVRLGDDVPNRMEASRSVVVEALRGDAPVYGVNTGFGAPTCPPGCSSCSPSTCCRSSRARARWAPQVTWPSSRTWPSR
jgi:hypothetical protein